jgi:hypothetical protein
LAGVAAALLNIGFLQHALREVPLRGASAFWAGFLARTSARPARKEGPVYLYASLGTLAGRADVPLFFLVRKLAAYSVLAGCVARCSIDTGANGPLDVVRGVLECLCRSR